ncbi:hypothetical protein LEMLEM_LOCUS11242, partial [Lemmus lemmus]
MDPPSAYCPLCFMRQLSPLYLRICLSLLPQDQHYKFRPPCLGFRRTLRLNSGPNACTWRGSTEEIKVIAKAPKFRLTWRRGREVAMEVAGMQSEASITLSSLHPSLTPVSFEVMVMLRQRMAGHCWTSSMMGRCWRAQQCQLMAKLTVKVW